MDNKPIKYIFLVLGSLVLLAIGTFFGSRYMCENKGSEKVKPKGMMLLIEFNNTDGLANMVNDMRERNIKGLLMVNADFIKKNAEELKEILKTGVVELCPSYDPEPFWGMPYEKQYTIIKEMLENSKEYLGVTPRAISSRYMASDETTLKVADELGIEYITARGTTELATTIYKPEEYNVKIISVSNIDVPEFKYGSFCDYSFYERAGEPEDMEEQFQRAIQNKKIMATSHTYIGGFKERWNDMWHRLWDNYDVEWVDLDTLGSVDKTMPTWQIPVNKNAPYTPEKIRPKLEFQDETNVMNPCKVEDLNEDSTYIPKEKSNRVVVFHNGSGNMCLDMLAFFKEHKIQYEEHLTTDTDFISQLNSYKKGESEGVSDSYGYYPIIFIGDRAFSGFNKEIEGKIKEILEIK
jgi:peptidoglycan/xylan/chitin deacetylase (PgdA/CDA1 family)